MPALEHEGEIVWDSPRILDYLDTHFPDRPLYPADPAGRAQTRVFAEWFNRVWKVAPNALADEGRDAALSDRLRADQDVFEGLLSDGREYLVGEFGMADVVAWPFLRYAVDDDPADDERFHEVLRAHLDVDGRPSLAAWIDRMAARFAARWRFDPL